MICLNEKKIINVKVASRIIPESVCTYPDNLVYGAHYRSGTLNADGKGFNVDGMTEYIDSENSDQYFFVIMGVTDLTIDENGIGFVIDLGANKKVDIVQLYMMPAWTDVGVCVSGISEDNVVCSETIFTHVSDYSFPTQTYKVNIDKEIRYIRITQKDGSYGGWQFRFIVRGVEVFEPMHTAGCKLLKR